jgi:hypothetical protein
LTDYVKFTERNDWEGEIWRFWIPLPGNEDILEKLKNALEDSGFEEYSLDLTPIPEADVDVLVQHAEVGYMASHNKLCGLLRISDEDLSKLLDNDDLFYKGEIKAYINEEPMK